MGQGTTNDGKCKHDHGHGRWDPETLVVVLSAWRIEKNLCHVLCGSQ